MKINYSVKQMGKKHPLIGRSTIEIKDISQPAPLRDLISAIVTQQVEAFNQRKSENNIIPYLLDQDIDSQKEHGKVGFNDSYNNELANVDEAIENALLSFEDGIYCVFIDDEQVEHLNDRVNISADSILYFIRLTFLSGSIW
ncbi:hypothetical protein LVD15_01910 [Fulvivirga maritima]|uniref:hypothetical protein n=1 Tax=Fulvivirga maritima TaxID=2904247 RepID=UPI001F4846B9|nr:hypothetical protein [Fulvivirga maritima]UII27205.1 hypothetical protein LVD15_01910 [Fulvivirga maritima]